MKSEISSDYLFHFTKEFNAIKGILRDGFKPFYCFERLNYLNLRDSSDNKFEMAFPIVSFCDLTEDKQSQHKQKFGKYAIVLSKEWGIRNNLTPVIYCNDQTITSRSLIELFNFADNIHSEKGKNNKSYKIISNIFTSLILLYKDYEGNVYDKDNQVFSEKRTRFYDEREWRYIPFAMDGLKYNLEKEEYEDEEYRDTENRDIQAREENLLKFNVDDLQNIYLKNKKEEKELLNYLKEYYTEIALEKLKNKMKII
jgi:hypothetical protein